MPTVGTATYSHTHTLTMLEIKYWILSAALLLAGWIIKGVVQWAVRTTQEILLDIRDELRKLNEELIKQELQISGLRETSHDHENRIRALEAKK